MAAPEDSLVIYSNQNGFIQYIDWKTVFKDEQKSEWKSEYLKLEDWLVVWLWDAIFSFVYNLVDLYTTYFPPSMLFCATATFDHTIGSATQALMHWIIFRIKEKGSI